ncbi:MAG: hypothetical protein RLZZ241_2611 [Bacteroidota bacterium]|jgi:hypothetical protein
MLFELQLKIPVSGLTFLNSSIMKKHLIALVFSLPFLFSSCEGPAGPPGYDGIDGVDGLNGINIVGQVYDITGDFTAANNYSLYSVFAQDAPGVTVFETDVVLVYILWEQVDSASGPIDIWRLLPQTRLLNQGILQYNFDFTFQDVSVFLESDFSLSTLLPGDTQNQTFRIAILPGDGLGASKIDVSNMEEVLNFLHLDSNQIPRIYLSE